MNIKKTRIERQDIEIENSHEFKESPRIDSLDLIWSLTLAESSAAISLIFTIPDQKIVSRGTIEDDEGDIEDVYFTIELPVDRAISEGRESRLMARDIFPNQVEMRITSLEKVDDYNYTIKLDKFSVIF